MDIPVKPTCFCGCGGKLSYWSVYFSKRECRWRYMQALGRQVTAYVDLPLDAHKKRRELLDKARAGDIEAQHDLYRKYGLTGVYNQEHGKMVTWEGQNTPNQPSYAG